MGLSRGITVHVGNSFATAWEMTLVASGGTRRASSTTKTIKLKLNRSQKQLAKYQDKQKRQIESNFFFACGLLIHTELRTVLNFQERQDLLELTENDIEMGDLDASNWIDEDDLDTTLAAPPPGEEGFFLSHEGGESSLQQIFVESMAERYELLQILPLCRNVTFFLGNVMISEHDKIESNIRCSSGAHSYPIS